MIKKLKYYASVMFKNKCMQLRAVALVAAAIIASTTLLDASIHTINIFDGSTTYTVRSFTSNVANAMDDVNLKSSKYKILETKTEDNITSVKISYSFPVFVTIGDKTNKIDFCGGTVRDALASMGVIPDKFDFVEPALDTVLTKTTYIDYTDISYITSTETEKIPYGTDKTYSSSLKKGKKKTTKEGKDGLKEVTYTEKLINGVSVEKTVIKTVTLSKAVDKKVTVGTKTKTKSAKKGDCISTLSPKKKIELDENGVPVKYKSKMKVRATAYTHTGNRCSTGVKPQPGYIAVNPKVIPYGTEMFIKTTDGKYIYGYAVAADTGGFIKKHPTGIDLFFDTKAECVNFGVRTAEIYILN